MGSGGSGGGGLGRLGPGVEPAADIEKTPALHMVTDPHLGLYMMERVARGEMVVEYVGEVVRVQVGSFGLQLVLTMWLCPCRHLINHLCNLNCTGKIIMISREKKIVFTHCDTEDCGFEE